MAVRWRLPARFLFEHRAGEPNLFLRVTEWINQISRLVFGGPYDHPFFKVDHLSQIISRHILPLRHDHARLSPFAILAERYRTNNRIERMTAHVICDL